MEFISSLLDIPDVSTKRIAMRITKLAQRMLRKGHPWIFDRSIVEQSHEGASGDLAVIFDEKRRFQAVGLYDPASPIRVRVLQFLQPAAINADWFQSKLFAAAKIRASLSEKHTNGYRLVHGENDGLPGLIVDCYSDTLVIKLYTPAWISHLENVCNALTQVNSAKHLVLRLNRSTQKQLDLLHGLEDGMTLTLQVPPDLILFKENGLIFEADPIHGQKTGFFLDQRDNRARVEKLSKGKSVLNVFSYTGGFSVYAARGGAKEVVSVDVSRQVLEAAVRNMAHNDLTTPHETIAEDAFDALARMASQKRLFDMVIIDPPMFAQSESQIEAALSAYRKLTHLGLAVLRKGGTFVQASCSSRVDEVSFFESIYRVAKEAGRKLEEIERTGHALDHPIGFKEGSYLKCLFATVR